MTTAPRPRLGVGLALCGAFLVGVMSFGGPLLADAGRISGGASGGLSLAAADLLYAKLAGSTLTGGLVFSAVSADVGSSTGEDFVVNGGGTSGSVGSVILNSRDMITEILGNNANGTMDCATANTCRYQGAALGTVGATLNRSAGQAAGCFSDNGTTAHFCANGDGAAQWNTSVTSLAGTLCDSAGEVGQIYRYNDTVSNKVSFCACVQTNTGTFAFEGIHASADCT